MIHENISSSSSSFSSSSSSSSYSSSFTSFSHSLTHSSTTPSDQNTKIDSTLQSNKTFKRSKAIQELLHTESIYSSDLIVICDIYLYRSTGPPPSPPPLSPSDRQIIFSNISQIAHLAQTLACELVVANQKNSIGDCFIQFLPRIEKLYTIYCSKYEFANKKLEKFKQKIHTKRKKLQFSSPTTNSPSHSSHSNQQQQQNESNRLNNEHPGMKYLEECKSLSQGRTSAWDLGSLLIKPVQRCLKYSLLLDQIIKFTEPDHPDLQNLILARDGMINVADKINEAKRRNELVGEMITRSGPIGAIYPAVLLVGQQGGSNHNRWGTPAELNRLINQVKRSEKALNRLPGDIRNSEYSVKNWILSADRLAEAFKATFLLRNSLDQVSPPRFSNLDVSDLHRYQHLVLLGALNGPLKYLHDKIELQIIPKINELKELYSKPMMLIDKYEKRRHIMMSGSINPKASRDVLSPRSSEFSSAQSVESNPNRTPPSTSNGNNTSTSNKISELQEVEKFLLDQLPKLSKTGTLSLNLILANLADAFKLFHSDLTILINKVVFDA